MSTRAIFLLAAVLAAALGGLLWWQARQSQGELALHAGVFQFVAGHPQLKALVGDPVPTKLVRAERGPDGVRYEFDIGGTRALFAIVEAGPGEPRLLCVTRLAAPERDPNKDACAQGAVPLPPVPA